MANPLLGLSRTTKTYVTLPSRGLFYTDLTIETIETTGEVGIKAMTATDEITFKNPDALLNGQAMSQALKSCVNGLKDPKKLLVNDVDALMVGIRIATHGDDMDISVDCPSCNENQIFGLNLPYVLSDMGTIEGEYQVNVSGGTSVYIKPYIYEDTIKASLATFEQTKTLRKLDDAGLPEDEKMKIFTKSFNALLSTNLEMLANSIVKVVNEEKEICVENNLANKASIIEFIKQMEKNDNDLIKEKLKEINSIGVKKEVDIVCTKCEHAWSANVEFDPVSFFSGS